MLFICIIGGCGMIDSKNNEFMKWLDNINTGRLRQITYLTMIVFSFGSWYLIIKLIKYLYSLIIGE